MYTSDRMKNIASGTRGVVYKEALKIQSEGNKILKLNTGNPAAFGFKMPESLKNALKQDIDKLTAYSESTGYKEALESILEYNLSKGFKDISTKDIFIGNGVSELAEIACIAAINPGDEVLCPSPNYNLWSNSAIIAGGKPVFYQCFEENGWMPDIEEIEGHITNKTKAIVIINPNNPTGALYSNELLLGIIELAKKYKLLIFADEIYDRILMDGVVHTSIAALSSDTPILTFNGLSKSHVVCGIRSGWLTLSGFDKDDTQLRDAIDTLCSVRLCSNTAGQYSIPAALKDPAYTKSMLVPGGRIYEQRESCINAINNSKCLSVVKNVAALYCFVRINPELVHIENDKEFIKELVKEKHILVVPGSGFDYPKQNYFRVVMLPEKEELKRAIEEIDDFCANYDKTHM